MKKFIEKEKQKKDKNEKSCEVSPLLKKVYGFKIKKEGKTRSASTPVERPSVQKNSIGNSINIENPKKPFLFMKKKNSKFAKNNHYSQNSGNDLPLKKQDVPVGGKTHLLFDKPIFEKDRNVNPKKNNFFMRSSGKNKSRLSPKKRPVSSPTSFNRSFYLKIEKEGSKINPK